MDKNFKGKNNYQMVNLDRLPKMGRPVAIQIWNLDWRTHLPRELATDKLKIKFEYSNFQKTGEFLYQQRENLFEKGNSKPNASLETNQQKNLYLENFCDHFIISSKENTIGITICEVLDWSTYYLRFVAIDPKFQGMGIYTKCLQEIIKILKNHSVERLETDVAPNNSKHLALLLKFGFKVSGSLQSDRWGSLIRLSYFLSEGTGTKFDKIFCPKTLSN